MRIGLVVGSSCDLPKRFIDEHGIRVMPIEMRVGGSLLEDDRDEAMALAFYRRSEDRRGEDYAESIPCSAERIEQLFLQGLVLEFEHVFCLAPTATRSPLYGNVIKASFGVVSKYKPIRKEAGLEPRFSLAAINSRNVLSGEGVLAAALISLIQKGGSPSVIDQRIRDFVPHTCTYVVPDDLFHLYKRASRRGDSTFNWAGYKLGSMLDIKPIIRCCADRIDTVAKVRRFDQAAAIVFANATRAIEAGLLAPVVCISYGGDPARLNQLSGYARLVQVAQAAGVTVHRAPASIAGSINIGPGCLSIGFVSDRHVFEEGK